jgi:hypothetical protein
MVDDLAASVFLLEDKVESRGRGEGEGGRGRDTEAELDREAVCFCARAARIWLFVCMRI